MRNIVDLLGLVAVWAGIGFCIVGVVGTVRMPDVYCRLHASGKVATIGLCGLLVGAALIMPSAGLKLLTLAVFAVLTLPVSTHAIAAAAYRHGVPVQKGGEKALTPDVTPVRHSKGDPGLR